MLLVFISCFFAFSAIADSGPVATLTFNLDSCTSYRFNDTNTDYSEFTPTVVNTADVGLSVPGNGHLYRSNPLLNPHSCTPGLNGTEAMCINYDSNCNYNPGSDRAVRFDVEVTPLGSLPAQLTGLNFQELAPEMFDWIDGPSGSNNYPTLYGVRVLKNGAVIFDQGGIETTTAWSLESFNFAGNPEFTVSEATVFSFEILAYCPVGAFALQSIWDLEDISVTATCASDCPVVIDGGTVSLTDGTTDYTGCAGNINCLLYTSPSPRDRTRSRMPSSA